MGVTDQTFFHKTTYEKASISSSLTKTTEEIRIFQWKRIIPTIVVIKLAISDILIAVEYFSCNIDLIRTTSLRKTNSSTNKIFLTKVDKSKVASGKVKEFIKTEKKSSFNGSLLIKSK